MLTSFSKIKYLLAVGTKTIKQKPEELAESGFFYTDVEIIYSVSLWNNCDRITNDR